MRRLAMRLQGGAMIEQSGTRMIPERETPVLIAGGGPVVVDCKVNPQIRGAWFDKVFAPGGWYLRMLGH